MTAVTAVRRPRVWLVGRLFTTDTAPVDLVSVRDDLMRRWAPGEDGRWHTADGRHHATWHELRTRFDLVEVAR